MDDSSNVPSPYVKIILKQQRSKRTKRKTHSIKNSCDPIYNKRFEFDISSDKLKTSELDVIVKTKESMLSKKLIGMVLFDFDLFFFSVFQDVCSFSRNLVFSNLDL